MTNEDTLDWDLQERDAWLAAQGYDESETAPVEVLVGEDD